MYASITIVGKKKGHASEGEQKRVYGKVEREDRKGRNVAIML